MESNNTQKKEKRNRFLREFIPNCLGSFLGIFLTELIDVGHYIESKWGKFAIEVVIIMIAIFVVNAIANLIIKLAKKK